MTRGLNLKPFVEELTLGTLYGVFVDDSGSPGWQPKSTDPTQPYPIGDSWVAVIVRPSHMPAVFKDLNTAMEDARQRFQIKEFHASELYSGKGTFRAADVETRFSLFRSLVSILHSHELPVIVQTLDPSSNLMEIGKERGERRLRHCWDLRKPKDMAFVTLLWRIEQYLSEENKKSPTVAARVFVDEGYYKGGAAMSGFPAFTEESIYFADSVLVPPLQLADFVAFTVNRHQLLTSKDTFDPIDVLFLSITSIFAPNLLNVELKPIDIKPSGGTNPLR